MDQQQIEQLPVDAQDAVQKLLRLGGLIEDWGGFEKLVADLNRTGEVEVEHNAKLRGKSGAVRQIDVVIRHKQGLIEHLVIIDCKHWKDRVGRAEVDALANSVRELNASRGVIFFVVGFESGAITQAAADGIELFTVRTPTDEEWGAPGRHVDFFLSIAQTAIRNLTFPEARGFGFNPLSVNLHLGFGTGDSSKTPIESWPGSNARTLE